MSDHVIEVGHRSHPWIHMRVSCSCGALAHRVGTEVTLDRLNEIAHEHITAAEAGFTVRPGDVPTNPMMRATT